MGTELATDCRFLIELAPNGLNGWRSRAFGSSLAVVEFVAA
jgi:hypothetical protein